MLRGLLLLPTLLVRGGGAEVICVRPRKRCRRLAAAQQDKGSVLAATKAVVTQDTRAFLAATKAVETRKAKALSHLHCWTVCPRRPQLQQHFCPLDLDRSQGKGTALETNGSGKASRGSVSAACR